MIYVLLENKPLGGGEYTYVFVVNHTITSIKHGVWHIMDI